MRTADSGRTGRARSGPGRATEMNRQPGASSRLAGAGLRREPLSPALRTAAERATGVDLRDVVVLRGALPAGAPRAVAATYGRSVYLSPHTPAADSREGAQILLHELAHAASQPRAATAPHSPSPPWAEPAARHATRAALGLAPVLPLPRSEAAFWAGFDDMQHRIIEELALAKSLTPEELAQTYQGNLERDFSQVPAFGNAVLIGKPRRFGGYKAVEHFDNVIWDYEKGRFFPKRPDGKPGKGGQDPVAYIEEELAASVKANGDPRFDHLGRALHALEDFFAHSNFLELTRLPVEQRSREENRLQTGSFEGADRIVTILAKGEAYAPNSATRGSADAAREGTKEGSHSRLAKDDPSRPGFFEAAALAVGLVGEVGALMALCYRSLKPAERDDYLKQAQQLVRARLRPPMEETDKGWWVPYLKPERLAAVRRAMAGRDATGNQWPFSPARALAFSGPQSVVQPLPFLSLGASDRVMVGKTPVQLNVAAGLMLLRSPRGRDEKEKPDLRVVPGFGFQALW